MNIQQNAKKTGKENSNLIEYIAVEGTPFQIAIREKENSKEKDYFILMGVHKLSDAYKTEKEAVKEAKKVDWWKVMGVCHAIATEVIKESNRVIEKIKN